VNSSSPLCLVWAWRGRVHHLHWPRPDIVTCSATRDYFSQLDSSKDTR
jgi:hypothetical protein